MKGKVYRIADLFCGAGGTSTGAVKAAREAGLQPSLTAVNHWPRAIETHTANHPEARHLCTNIDAVDPRGLFGIGELDLLLASPECMHHSVARGGRPVNDQSRATAWCVTRWAEALQPGTILVENVPEFLDWAPIGTNGRPLKSQRGAVFQGWVAALRALGYTVEWRILCAADYGDPTTRRRLFVQAVRGRRKIRWPERTHGATGADDFFPVQPYRTAREVINWNHTSRSIYDPKRRPLSPNTLRRIEIGLRRYGLGAFLVPQQSRHETRSVDVPLPTVVGNSTGEGLVEPFLVPVSHQGGDKRRIHDLKKPVKTPTATGNLGICEPFIVQANFGERHESRVSSMDEPLKTVLGSNIYGVCEPWIQRVGHYGKDGEGAPNLRGVDEPLSTVTTKQEHALAQPYLVKLRGTSKEQIEKHSSQSVDGPLPTITAGGGHMGLCEPFLTPFYGSSGAVSVDEPLDTVTCKDRFGLVQPCLMIDGEKYLLDVHFRMLQPDELSKAQGFPENYQFTGTKTEITKQIGNAVPCGLARALVSAVIG
jgi:DNA (cytosine-5)-methyltransferase 1